MLIIPENKIKKYYTKPNEWVFVSSYKDYNGPYIEYKNKFYTGKLLDNNSEEIISKSSPSSNFILSNNTVYNQIKQNRGGISSQFINTDNPISIDFNPLRYKENIIKRYFLKNKTNKNFIDIIEVDSKTYNKYYSNTLYENAQIIWDLTLKNIDLEIFEKNMKGLSLFLNQNIFTEETIIEKSIPKVKYFGEGIEGITKNYE